MRFGGSIVFGLLSEFVFNAGAGCFSNPSSEDPIFFTGLAGFSVALQANKLKHAIAVQERH